MNGLIFKFREPKGESQSTTRLPTENHSSSLVSGSLYIEEQSRDSDPNFF